MLSYHEEERIRGELSVSASQGVPPFSFLSLFPDLAFLPSCQFQSRNERAWGKCASECALKRLCISRSTAVDSSILSRTVGLESKPSVFKTLFKKVKMETSTQTINTRVNRKCFVNDIEHLWVGF